MAGPDDKRGWGARMARHRRVVIAIWIVAIVGGALSYGPLQGRLSPPDYSVGGSGSARAAALANRYFGSFGAEQDAVVLHSSAGTITAPDARGAIARILAAVRGVEGVATVRGPFGPAAPGQIASDRRAALAIVGIRGDPAARASTAEAIQAVLERSRASGPITAWLTGYSPITNDLNAVEQSDIERAEAIGIPVAFAVLVLALGAVAAAAVPLALALVGLLGTFALVALLSLVFAFDTFAITIATMIGVGIGIDYSLFVLARFREEFGRRIPDRPDRGARERVAAAADVAVASAGRSVAVSAALLGGTLCSLLIVDSPIFRGVSIAVIATVAVVLLACLTLLPASMAALGPRLESWSLPGRLRPADLSSGRAGGGGWARLVMRHPLALGVPVAALLVIAALPLGSLRYGVSLSAGSLAGKPTAEAQAVIDRSFPPGVVSPIQVIVTGPDGAALSPSALRAERRFVSELEGDRRVAAVEVERSRGRTLLSVVASAPIDSLTAENLVGWIRRRPLPDTIETAVGGSTAQFKDLAGEIAAKLPYVLAIVMALSALVLLIALRSVVIPLKAVALNLLSSAASVGLTVTVFQSGAGGDLLGFTSLGYLPAYLPITVFVVLFGLSMDYELFLVGRMKEAWERTGENAAAVASGIEHTARPISAAAAIMVAVFGSFLTADVLELKQFGFALAAAVAIDATLVRLVLVPALMRLAGATNWWFPGRARRAREGRTPTRASGPR